MLNRSGEGRRGERIAENEEDHGHIFVQQSFDVRNEVWDGDEGVLKGGAGIVVAGERIVKIESCSDGDGNGVSTGSVFTRTREVFDEGRSSDEEELVRGKSGRGTPVLAPGRR